MTEKFTFAGNGAEGGSVNGLNMVVGFSGNLPANSFYYYAHIFTGWNTKPDGTGTAYSVGQSVRDLGGDGDISEVLLDPEMPDPFIGRIEGFAALTRGEPECADPAKRAGNFDPVERPFTCEQAQCEAERCLQCDLRLQITRPRLWNEY